MEDNQYVFISLRNLWSAKQVWKIVIVTNYDNWIAFNRGRQPLPHASHLVGSIALHIMRQILYTKLCASCRTQCSYSVTFQCSNLNNTDFSHHLVSTQDGDWDHNDGLYEDELGNLFLPCEKENKNHYESWLSLALHEKHSDWNTFECIQNWAVNCSSLLVS